MDTLLENGTVVDGTGAPRRSASVLIRNGKVAQIGPSIAETPELQRIDCTGLVVAPGFVDVHTHSDYQIIEGRSNKVLQGVTTEIVGNCSFSLFPMRRELAQQQAEGLFEDLPPLQMRSAEDYFSAVETAKPLVNVATLTGHSALRTYVIGMDRRAPANDEQKEMERHLEQSLDEGSIGFSTGLNCLPSSFADFDELVAFCRVLKPYGAYYATHMRDYKFHVVEAVEEAIRLAEEADVPVQLSHVQVVGKKNWRHLDTILELVDSAERRGIDVGMDAYPYLAGSCSLVQFLPEWCQDGGLPVLLERLESATQRDRIARETDAYMSNTWADIVVCGVKHNSGSYLLGKSIEQIAADRNADPHAAAIDMLREQEGVVSVISFNSCDDNLRKVLSHPLTSVCSDSLVTKGLNHPRTFGTYPEFLGRCVRDRGWMPLEDAIAKTSAVPARRFRLQDRGTIAPGNWADLVVFDPAAIGTKSDYTSPSVPPEGIDLVLVNGEIVVDKGNSDGQSSRRRPAVSGLVQPSGPSAIGSLVLEACFMLSFY